MKRIAASCGGAAGASAAAAAAFLVLNDFPDGQNHCRQNQSYYYKIYHLCTPLVARPICEQILFCDYIAMQS